MYKFIIVTFLLYSCFNTGGAFKIQSKIINGWTASPGQFPYFVNLKIYSQETNEDKNLFVRCGASLISNLWVLTASHCLLDANSLTAHFGSIEKNPSDFETGHVTMNIDQNNFFMHPQYCAPKYLFDIGKINEEIKHSQNISTDDHFL